MTYTLEMYALDDAVDGMHDPAQGFKNAETFVSNSSVLAMVGPINSNVARAQMPILNRAVLAHISPFTSAPSLTDPEYGETKDLRPTDNLTYFRVNAASDLEGPAAADFMFDKLNVRKLALFEDTETYAKAIADGLQQEFVAKGGPLTLVQSVPLGTIDFSSIISDIVSLQPDGIFYGGLYDGPNLALQQLREVGSNVLFMGDDGILDQAFVDEVGSDGIGAYCVAAGVDATKLPEAQQFISDYRARFNEEIGAYSAKPMRPQT